MFDNSNTTRWHSTGYDGGAPFVDEDTTPYQYDFTFAGEVDITRLEIYTWDSASRLVGLRFRLFNVDNTILWERVNRGTGVATENFPLSGTLVIPM